MTFGELRGIIKARDGKPAQPSPSGAEGVKTMKFVFTDKKINLPNKVHAYAEKKVGKLDRYFKADAEAAIVFSVEKGRNNVELTIRSGGTIIRVAESTSISTRQPYEMPYRISILPP